MTEQGEVRVSHEEVEGFVMKLKAFHGSLDETERAMLGTILESAQTEIPVATAYVPVGATRTRGRIARVLTPLLGGTT